MAAGGELRCGAVWTFACVAHPQTGQCEPQTNADILVAIDEAHLAAKKHIVRDVYGYPEGSFEVTACISPEGFHRRPISRKGSRE